MGLFKKKSITELRRLKEEQTLKLEAAQAKARRYAERRKLEASIARQKKATRLLNTFERREALKKVGKTSRVAWRGAKKVSRVAARGAAKMGEYVKSVDLGLDDYKPKKRKR